MKILWWLKRELSEDGTRIGLYFVLAWITAGLLFGYWG